MTVCDFSERELLHGNTKNLTMLQATMAALTASTDLIVAVAQMQPLHQILNMSHPDGDIPSSAYVRRVLLNDSSSFRLGRFRTAIEAVMDQLNQRLETSRKLFAKRVSQYVDSLSDAFQVVENYPIARGTYSVRGYTARQVNVHLKRLAVSYLYLPLVVGSQDGNLLSNFGRLSTKDSRQDMRMRLWRKRNGLRDTRDKLKETLTRTRNDDNGLILMDMYSRLDGANWIRKKNWGSDLPISAWEGVTINRRGGVIALDLKENNVSGRIPESLFGLISLVSLDLSKNSLTGTIPAEFAALRLLGSLSLNDNSLVGTVPDEIFSGLQILRTLYLHGNSLSGEILGRVTLLPTLTHVTLGNNHFVGSIPRNVSRLNQLIGLDVSANSFTGSIPEEFCMLSELRVMGLSHNHFVGTLPSGMRKLQSLREIHVQYNNFSGPLPSGLFALRELKGLYLQNNSFTGSLSSDIGMLDKLHSLDISSNRFTGALPATVSSLTRLTQLIVHSNQFRGGLPGGIAALHQLEIVYMFDNEFSGPIPAGLMELSDLRVLYLDNNKYTGTT